jgi:hypothetical protein
MKLKMAIETTYTAREIFAKQYIEQNIQIKQLKKLFI